MTPRKDNGQFAKGHSGNPNGHPKRSTGEKYLAALSRRVELEDWNKIIDTAITRAMPAKAQNADGICSTTACGSLGQGDPFCLTSMGASLATR